MIIPKQHIYLLVFCINTLAAYSQNGEIIAYTKINASNGVLTNLKSFGAEVANIGDLNQDGVEDLAIGTINQNTFEGNVLILFLNKDLSIKSSSRIGPNIGGLYGSFPNSMSGFGSAICSIGDIDSDGTNDLIVGNKTGGVNAMGEAYVIFLNSSGTVKSFKLLSATSFSVSTSNAYWGSSITNIGDIDNNGTDDFALSATNDFDNGPFSGIIFIMKLKSDGSILSYSKISSTNGNFHGILTSAINFGFSIAAIGDLNKDGNTDLFASTFDDNSLWILFLDSLGKVKEHQKISQDSGQYTDSIKPSEVFGFEVTSIGDLDGDNNTDVAITSLKDSVNGLETGRVRILFLNSNGTVKGIRRIDNNSNNFNNVVNDGDFFGYGLSGNIDLNGDFKNDLIIGAPSTDDGGQNKGAIYLLSLDGVIHPTPPKSLWRVNATTGNQNTVFNFTQYSTGFPSTYKWIFTPSNVAYQNGTTDTSPNPVVKFTQSANYWVQLKVTNPFNSDSLLRYSYINVQTTGLFTPNTTQIQIELYPNPTNSNITIQSPVTMQQIWVYDITGKQLLLQQPDAKQDEINLSELCNGIYFIQIQTLQGVQVHKITKQ